MTIRWRLALAAFGLPAALAGGVAVYDLCVEPSKRILLVPGLMWVGPSLVTLGLSALVAAMLSGQRIETATRRRIGIATAGTGALLLAALLLSALRAAADEGMLFSILFYLAGQSGVCLLLLSVPVLLSARTGSGKPAANNIRV